MIRRFQFSLRAIFWGILVVASFFAGRASMNGAIERLGFQITDLAEHKALKQERIHEQAGEIFDLRRKLMTSTLGLSLTPVRTPCVVGRVSDAFPAATAGIAVGDVILSINGEPLPENDGHLEEALPRYFGQRVDFMLRRESEFVTATVDLRSPLDNHADE